MTKLTAIQKMEAVQCTPAADVLANRFVLEDMGIFICGMPEV